MRPAGPRADRTLTRSQRVVAALGLALTLVAIIVVHAPRGVYWTDTGVYFLAPVNDRHGHVNTYAYTTDSVIATAGLVERLVQPNASSSGTGTQTTLLAQGVRHGSQVRLPNSGGQWTLNFDKPLLDVQVVGTTPEEVTRETARLLDRIQQTLDEVQEGVAPDSRMVLTRAPSEPQVRYSQGDPRRAMVGALLAGTLLTIMLVALAGRRRSTRIPEQDTGPAARTERADAPADAPTDPPTAEARRHAPAGVS
jgi:hypothetical protein